MKHTGAGHEDECSRKKNGGREYRLNVNRFEKISKWMVREGKGESEKRKATQTERTDPTRRVEKRLEIAPDALYFEKKGRSVALNVVFCKTGRCIDYRLWRHVQRVEESEGWLGDGVRGCYPDIILPIWSVSLFRLRFPRTRLTTPNPLCPIVDTQNSVLPDDVIEIRVPSFSVATSALQQNPQSTEYRCYHHEN